MQNLIVEASSSLSVGTKVSFDAGNDVSTTASNITFASADGLSTGDLVTYENPTPNADIGGLTSGSDYYVLVVNPTTIQLQPASAIALSTASQGTQSLVVVSSSNAGLSPGTALSFDGAADVDTTAGTITYTLPSLLTSGLKTGDEVVYVNTTGNADIGGLQSGLTYTVLASGANSVQLTQTFATDPGWETGDEVVYLGNGNGTSDVTGLSVGQDYYVVEQSPGVLQFSAAALSTVSLTSASSGTQNLVVVSSADPAFPANTSLSFDAAAGVNTLTNTLTFAAPDGLRTGDLVQYQNSSGNADIGGLTSGQDYYVVTVDPSIIELTTSQTMVVPLATAASVVLSGDTPQVILAAPLGPGAGPFADTRGGALVAFGLSTAVMSGFQSSISAAATSTSTAGAGGKRREHHRLLVSDEVLKSLASVGNQSEPATEKGTRYAPFARPLEAALGSLFTQFGALKFPLNSNLTSRVPAASNSASAVVQNAQAAAKTLRHGHLPGRCRCWSRRTRCSPPWVRAQSLNRGQA